MKLTLNFLLAKNSIKQDLSLGAQIASGTIYNISAGSWELLVEAKDSSGTVLYRGRANVIIQESQTTYVSINLASASTSGDLAINVSWEQGDGISWTKYAANPVIDLGPAGSWDEKSASIATVIYEGNLYKMWYTGYNGTLYQLGYATSPDGINWTKYAGNPVMSCGAAGSWEAVIGGPSVIYDGITYKMWYAGADASSKTRIGYATAVDGINWTKYSGNPVLNVGASGTWDATEVGNPSVLYDGTTYKMWFTGYNGSASRRTGYATSPDGVNWIKYTGNPILSLGTSGTWDDVANNAPCVIYTGTEYKMWYSGLDGYSWKIGYASSPDGKTWTKYSGNPVISNGAAGTSDRGGASHPVVLYNGITYKMWYAGIDSIYLRTVLATSPKL